MTTPMRQAHPRLVRAALWAGGVLVLAMVALAYLDPHLMLDLADRFWSCF